MQTIVTPLEAVLTADVRRPRIKVRASWLKVEDSGVAYAIVGSSVIDGGDLVQGQSVVITNADLFSYMDESDNVMRLDYDRRVDEPRGGISYAIANVLLDNITKRYTPNHNATIGTAIEARRPFKMSVGFDAGGVDRMTQVMVGLTAGRPKQGRTEETVTVDIYDYITFINNATIAAAIYEDVTGRDIIEDILISLGFGSTQYELDDSLNTIPFAWFDKNKKAGTRIREVCEAEEATFYQDENGILRFENRNHIANYPYLTPVRTIDADDIISDEDDDSTQIINRAIVTGKPRKVDAAATDIWSDAQVESIPHGQSITIWAAFYDDTGTNVQPVKEITAPASTTDYVGNTQADGLGADRTANLSVSVTNFVETAKIVVTNNHGSDTVYVTLLKLRGKAARVSQAIQAVVEDTDSINKFEAQEYPLENNLIQTQAMATIMATNLVAKYKDPMNRRKIIIPGIPHLQLKDLLYVMNPNAKNLVPNNSFEINLDYWDLVKSGTDHITLERSREIPIRAGYFAAKMNYAIERTGENLVVPSSYFTTESLDSGWGDWYGAGTISHDSVDFIEGTASVKIVADSGGGPCGPRKNIADVNMTGKDFSVWVKADDWTKVANAQVLISVSGLFDAFYYCDLKDILVTPPNDEWFKVPLNQSDFHLIGAGTWAGANDMIFKVAAVAGQTPTVHFDDFRSYSQGSQGYVSIVFDDSRKSIYDYGLAKLNQYSYRATHFVIPELFGADTTFMTQAEVDILADQGHDISGHGQVNLTTLTADELDTELARIRDYLRDRNYKGQSLYAYPNGGHNQAIDTKILEYFDYGRTIDGAANPTTNLHPQSIHCFTVGKDMTTATIKGYIDKATSGKSWVIITFHQLSASPTVDTEYEISKYEEIIDYLNTNNHTVLPMSEVIKRLTLTSAEMMNDSIKLITGHEYRLLLKARSPTDQTIRIKLDNSTGVTTNSETWHGLVHDTTTTIKVEFTALATDDASRIHLAPTIGMSAYFDDVTLIDLTEERKQYRVMRIQGSLIPGSFVQTLTLREKTASETA
jgi:peptidoglycan/xylan/chitin deacetylase (PgdA/CDA1 family)